jgi:DNA-binding response OmpR family regulator
MKKRILFMDNDADFLDVHVRMLEFAGYNVLKAYTLEDAKQLLNEHTLHLAIFDIRMIDDNDDKDISGQLLAQEKEYRNLPKIILTGYPDYNAVRKVLSIPANGTPAAVDFLSKKDGAKALIEAVGRVFEQHVRINWNLSITRDEHNSITFPQLVSAIIPDITSDLLLERADELESLFRSLFFREEVIRIERVLWQRDGRVAVTVFPFAKERALESLLVVCGSNTRINEELHLYREFAPPTHASTVLMKTHETTHFAANSYALADTDVDRVDALGKLWHTGPDKLFNTALHTLFEMTLLEWSKERRIPEERRTLDQVYRDRLGLTLERGISAEQFRERVNSIVHWIPTLGDKVEFEGTKLTFGFGGQSFTYSDPTPYIERRTKYGQPVLLTYTPGTLTGENILADANGHTWLTDFSEAGLAPLLWNFVSLEAAIRFDWVEPEKLNRLHEMERCLLNGEFSRFDTSDIEQLLKKPVRAIQTIRRLASRAVGRDALPYHLGILLHALKRIATFNPALPHKQSELLRYAHLLMSAAMISRHLKEAIKQSSESGIRIDRDNRSVWVDGTKVPLRGRTYDLLLGFYENANRLCQRRQIVEQFLGEKYDESDGSQVNRLNTAIFRLRERIEEDPYHPRFLITEPGGGYRLVPNPSD